MKNKVIKVLIVVFLAATAGICLWGLTSKSIRSHKAYSDGIEQIDPDTIYLKKSKVEVAFDEVLLSDQSESRKLIVSEQEGTASVQLTDRIIKILDFGWMKKTQTVSYKGQAYFVVDLSDLKKSDIVQDSKNKTVTIKIGHAYLEAVEVDPEEIVIDDVKEGLLARGEIKLTVRDFNEIEKEIRDRLEDMFNTAANGQAADKLALEMVQAVYEPVVKAIDSRYEVKVAFR